MSKSGTRKGKGHASRTVRRHGGYAPNSRNYSSQTSQTQMPTLITKTLTAREILVNLGLSHGVQWHPLVTRGQVQLSDISAKDLPANR